MTGADKVVARGWMIRTSFAGANIRESIECRSVAFWE
jgi:hypothetical protein